MKFKNADEAQRSGSGTKDNDLPYYRDLLFLKPALQHKQPLSSIPAIDQAATLNKEYILTMPMLAEHDFPATYTWPAGLASSNTNAGIYNASASQPFLQANSHTFSFPEPRQLYFSMAPSHYMNMSGFQHLSMMPPNVLGLATPHSYSHSPQPHPYAYTHSPQGHSYSPLPNSAATAATYPYMPFMMASRPLYVPSAASVATHLQMPVSSNQVSVQVPTSNISLKKIPEYDHFAKRN